jgi:probable HAF family extracellular repeat protein
MIDLGTLGGTTSLAHRINNKGEVVGRSFTAVGSNAYSAFLYNEIEGMLNLNNLIPLDSGWVLSYASNINYSGQIIGNGTIDGEDHAFLLTPVPEPCTMLLFIFGGIILRKRQNEERNN